MADTERYLYEAIQDAQGTIRALDVKVGFLLLIVFTPLFSFDHLEPVFAAISKESDLQYALVIAICLSWVLAIAALFVALRAVTPVNRIDGADGLGTFFGSGFFYLKPIHAFFNAGIKSKVTVAEAVGRLPRSDADLMCELAFEQMKLGYVRSVKAQRVNVAIFFIVVWLVLGLVSYVLHIWR